MGPRYSPAWLAQVTRGSSYLPADVQWGSRDLSSGCWRGRPVISLEPGPHLWGSLSSLMLPQMSLALFNKAKNPRLPGAIPRPQPAFTECLLWSRDSSQSSLCVEEETEA